MKENIDNFDKKSNDYLDIFDNKISTLNDKIFKIKDSKISGPNRFKYNLIDKLDLKNPNKNMALGSLSIYYTWKNVKSTYNNKFKILAPTWNETFDLPDGSYKYIRNTRLY